MTQRKLTNAEWSADRMATRWYVNVDDCVGGWQINTADKPASQLDHTTGEYMIGDVLTRELGEHICRLHNASVDAASFVAGLAQARRAELAATPRRWIARLAGRAGGRDLLLDGQ